MLINSYPFKGFLSTSKKSLDIYFLIILFSATIIINSRTSRLDKIIQNKDDDPSIITAWHQSIGFFYVEIAFHSHHLNVEYNKQICRTLNNMDELAKFNLTATLVNDIPFTKPDQDYHFCSSSLEIEECLSNKQADFLLLLDSILPHKYLKIKKVHKIRHEDSTLLGAPFPEKCFIRLRIDLICAQGRLSDK